MFETGLRKAVLEWPRGDPSLSGSLNAIIEEAPLRTSAPWLGVVASASADWSTKTARGREIRLVLELHCRGDAMDEGGDIVAAIEDRIETLPRAQAGFAIASATFLRGRAEQRPSNLRAILLEYRFRIIQS